MATTTQLCAMLDKVDARKIDATVLEALDKMMEKAAICLNAAVNGGSIDPTELDRYNRLAGKFGNVINRAGGGQNTVVSSPTSIGNSAIDLRAVEDDVRQFAEKKEPKVWLRVLYKYLNNAMNYRMTCIDSEIAKELKP